MKNIFLKILPRVFDLYYIKYILNRLFEKKTIRKNLNKLHHFNVEENNIEEINKKMLLKLIKFSYRNSTYYRNVLKNKKIDMKKISVDNVYDLVNKIPLLNKEIIRGNTKSILTVNSKKKYVGKMTTGGSTGEPLSFYTMGGYDKEHQEFLYKLMGYENGDLIIALDGTFIEKETLDQGIFWTEKNKSSIPYGKVALSSHYLNDDTIGEYIKYISESNVKIIRGYPSFIEKIARYILQNDIDIKSSLKGIQLTSESFYDYQVVLIKNAFNCNVYSQYGHAESSVFGYTINDQMEIYCSPFYGYTEVLNSDGEHVKSGEVGEIVVTGFNNTAMPFIRYQTGDLAVFSRRENGIVVLETIYGRTQDIIYSEDDQEIRLTALIFGRHYKAFDNIIKWQIVQNEKGKVAFNIVKSINYTEIDEKEIRDNFIELSGIETNFNYVNEIDLTKRGKNKFLIQNISM
ncbi:hypothetical protein [Exiguobacterium sp. 17-1]|uniref:hypothetical protein n=1 Tax=Exiguobacterium sp. 17-1 TaxID=2931981 RepID=UPI001FFF96C9|nr:hypothetical protein [Exiguobacterium sp. 17-1]MCK2156180.1 hypothetical protein [Exiguobacterium sp. 17-1]